MSVTVDDQPLAAESLGLQTVGQILSHVQRANRMVVNLLIDGLQPDLSQISRLRKSLVTGKTLYIETAAPCEMALDVLNDVQDQLNDAELYKTDAAELLQQNQISKAMEKLGVYFSTWQSAQEAVIKTCQLLRIDMQTMRVNSQSIAEILENFADQLRQTRQALSDRDFVSLADLLLYETTKTSQQWSDVIDAIRGMAVT